MNISDFTNITGAGIGVIAIVLFYRLAAEHISRNTEVMAQLRETISELKTIIANK